VDLLRIHHHVVAMRCRAAPTRGQVLTIADLRARGAVRPFTPAKRGKA
jgi:hypothetical protein